jgi:hypothetical protein
MSSLTIDIGQTKSRTWGKLTVVPQHARLQKSTSTPSINAYASNAFESVDSIATQTCGWSLVLKIDHSSIGQPLLAVSTTTEVTVTTRVLSY